jgi:hypothetical protein
MRMKPMHAEELLDRETAKSCAADGKDCGCSNGMCPGMILGGVVLAGWGIYALGTWIWGMIAG